MTQYPQRSDEPDCRDYLRTGRCKYGESCKYHHPIGGAKTPSDPREPPFPIRPNEPPCQYYLKHGTCKFGQTCKFHHPPHILTTGGNGTAVYMNLGNVNLLAQTCAPCGQKITLVNDDMIGSQDFHQSRSFVQLLPQRPGEADCIYFLRNGRCKYGATCKYHHPTDSFNSESNMNNSQQQLNFQGNLERSLDEISRSQSGHLFNHNSRKSDAPVATHVLYSSEGSIAVVPVSQTSAFHHLEGSALPNECAQKKTHQTMGEKYRESDHSSRHSSSFMFEKGSTPREFIPSSFHQQKHYRRDQLPTQDGHSRSNGDETLWRNQYHTSKDHSSRSSRRSGDTPRFVPLATKNDRPISSNSLDKMDSQYMPYNMTESSQQDTLSTSPNELGLQWSSVSTSSSCLSNENLWGDVPSQVSDNELVLGSRTLKDGSRRGNFDDGLSKMTSALLTMLDLPEENNEEKETPLQEETSSFYSDGSSSQGTPPLDLRDPSSGWFSNFSQTSPGTLNESTAHQQGGGTLRFGDTIFSSFPSNNKDTERQEYNTTPSQLFL